MSQILIDPQASGWYDDGSEGGALRVRRTSGDLVLVPFRPSHCIVTSGSHNKATTGDNGDDTSTSLPVTVAAGSSGYARIQWVFYGNTLGVRWLRYYYGGADWTFTVFIDGVAYGVTGGRKRWDDQTDYTTVDGMNHVIVATDLGAGPHQAEIVLVGDPSTEKRMLFFGYLVERMAGYQPPTKARTAPSTTTLSTTATTLATMYGGVEARYPNGLRKLQFWNTTASPVVVTIEYNTADIWSRSVPANDTIEWDPGDLVRLDYSTFKVRAASAAAVKCTAIGGY